MSLKYWGTLILTLILFHAHGQQCVPLFKHNYGGAGNDEALTIQSTSDRGSIVGGRTTSASAGSYDGFLMKLSETGDVQWSKNYGSAGYDEITQVLTAADGYITVGQTSSFGNANGEPFLMKVDFSGNLVWARTFVNDQTVRHRISKAILLNNGQIAMLINLNDSTSQGNAVVTKLSATGDMIWARVFDHGDRDYFNYLTQQKDSIVVVGTSVKPDGLTTGTILKLHIATGQTLKAWAIYRPKDYSEFENNTTMVATGPKGLMITHNFKAIYPNYNFRWNMADIQIADDGSKIFEKYVEASSNYSQEDNASIFSMQGPDYSFMHLYNDTLDNTGGDSRFTRMGGAVHTMQISRALYDDPFEYSQYAGMDTTGRNGYLFAGYNRTSWPIGQNWKIKVVKTDELLLTGNCPALPAGSHIFSVSLRIENFTWKSITDATGVFAKDRSFTVADNSFARIDGCIDTYCKPSPVFPQNCLSTFLLKMRGIGLPGIESIRKTDDGGYLAGGYYYWGRQTQALLTKIAANGSVEWSRGYINHTDEGMVQRVIAASDGSSIVTTSNQDHPDDNHTGDYATIMKVDNSGNVIWRKRLDINSYRHRIQALVATTDGGCILTANTNNASPDTERCLVIRLDANGNIIWQKQVTAGWASYLGYRELLLDGNDLYLGVNAHFAAAQPRIEKWNASNGQLLWSKTIGIEKVDESDVQGIYKIKDTVYMAVATRETGGGWGERISMRFIKVLPDGTLFDGFRLRDPNFSTTMITTTQNRDISPYVGKTNDGALVIAQQIHTGNVSSLGVIKVSPQGSVIWAKNFRNLNQQGVANVMADGDNILITGATYVYQPTSTDTRWDHTFILKLNSNGDVIQNATGSCSNEPLTVGIDPFPVAPPQQEAGANYADGSIQFVDQSCEFYPFEVQTSLECHTADICTTVTIEGEEKICDATAPFTYKAKKNDDCTSPVTWVYDAAFIQKISETDSTITVKFLQPSTTTSLIARLSSGCTGISDTKNIEVIKSANRLSLGNDTTLCAGNTISLDAGAGFVSYEWQDGSTGQQLDATQSGTYWVRVTDGCGNTSQDEILVDPAPEVTVGLNKPTATLCLGDSLKVTAPAGFMSYAWSPAYGITSTNSAETILFPQKDTLYKLTVERTPGCFGVDSIRFQIKTAPAIDLGADTSFCKGEQITLNAGSSFASYQWNNGATTPSVQVAEAGYYSVIGTSSDGCKAKDTLRIAEIYPLPIITLNQDPLLCEGSSRVLTAGNNSNTYLWSNGSTASTITVTGLGTYSVTATSAHGCIATGTTVITTISPLPKAFLPPDTSICSYGTLLLKPLGDFKSYSWSNGAAASSITIQQPGIYWLKATDPHACTGTDSILVSLKDCMTGVYVPTAFTPNKDGKNDILQPMVFGNLLKYRFVLYNRWGQIVFQTTDRNKGWDGSINGIQQDSNVFIWSCTYQLEGFPQKTEKGTVTLIR